MASLDDLIAADQGPSLDDVIGADAEQDQEEVEQSTEEENPIEYVRKEFNPDEVLRPKAVYCYGVQDLNNDQINAVFAKVAPKKIEWIDDGSCVLVFETDELLAKFYKKLTRPLTEGDEIWKKSPPIVLKEGEEPRQLQLRQCTVKDKKDRFHSGRVHSKFYKIKNEKKANEMRQKRKRDAMDAMQIEGVSDEIDMSLYERGNVDEEENAKRRKRADRFGDMVEESRSERIDRETEERRARKEEELEKRRKRAERFGIEEETMTSSNNNTITKNGIDLDPEELEKRKKRAERFQMAQDEDESMEDDRPRVVLKSNGLSDHMNDFERRRKARHADRW
eukprot:gene657-961_t